MTVREDSELPTAGVLICDDNEQIRRLLATIISTAPGLHVAGEAADGNEAVAEARRLQPDIVLLDLAMPNRSGLDVLPDLPRVAPAAQVIVFSGFGSAAVAEHAIALGAAAYLEKGARPDAIVAAIERALHSRGTPIAAA